MTLLSLARPLAVTLILFWIFSGEPASAQAGSIESLERIRQRAVDHAALSQPEQATLRAADLDPRLRLQACPTPLHARNLAQNATAVQVEVRCDSLGWKLYVPVTISVQVPVLVSLRAMARGERIEAGDVDVQMRDRASLGAGWLQSVDELRGQVLSRPLSAGAVLLPGALAAERVVRRGQAVTLISGRGAFQVRAQGKALSDAAAGDALRVENPSSRRVVQGRVQADGTVQIDL